MKTLKYKRTVISEYQEYNTALGTNLVQSDNIIYSKVKNTLKHILCRLVTEPQQKDSTKGNIAITIHDAPVVGSYRDGEYIFLTDGDIHSETSIKASNMIAINHDELVARLHELYDSGYIANFYLTNQLRLFSVVHISGDMVPYEQLMADPILNSYLVEAIIPDEEIIKHEGIKGYMLEMDNQYHTIYTEWYKQKTKYDASRLTDRQITEYIMNGDEELLYVYNEKHQRINDLSKKLRDKLNTEFPKAIEIYRAAKSLGNNRNTFIYKKCFEYKIPHMASIISQIRNDIEADHMIHDVYKFYLSTLK